MASSKLSEPEWSDCLKVTASVLTDIVLAKDEIALCELTLAKAKVDYHLKLADTLRSNGLSISNHAVCLNCGIIHRTNATHNCQ